MPNIHRGLLTFVFVCLSGCADYHQFLKKDHVTETVIQETVSQTAVSPPPDKFAEPFSITVLLAADSLPTSLEIPPVTPDLIARLRSGFRLPNPEQRAIDAQLSWYARHPDYLNRVFSRAERYMHWIVGALERRNMPMEIALLPVVESAYDPFAYSHGRAAGLWQFIPGTGRRFGIKQNWWFDGRRDVVDSTRGALDYLEYLHAEFDGDWLLAIAAYNSGEGNVRKAIRRNRRKGKATDFWHLKLPKETEAYVPKLLAISRLVATPAAYNVSLNEIPNEPYFAIVDTGSQIDLALAAELAGLDVDTLYTLNPGFNRWATDPDGPHRLLVPLEKRDELELALAALPGKERVRWARHRIRNGETLSTIANRYGTTSAVLRQVNGIRGNTIRAGHHLMIPTATKKLETYSLSADSRLKKKMANGNGRARSTYIVKTGDSLWDIARAHGVSTRSLAKWNGMAPGDTLAVGRTLVIWGGRLMLASGPQNKMRRVNYTVRRGDSLSRIATRFNVSVTQLKRWNKKLSGQRYIQPGQKLVMYVDITRQTG